MADQSRPYPPRLAGLFLLHSVTVLAWLGASVLCGATLALGFVWPLIARRGFSGAAVGFLLGGALWLLSVVAALSLAPAVRRILRAARPPTPVAAETPVATAPHAATGTPRSP